MSISLAYVVIFFIIICVISYLLGLNNISLLKVSSMNQDNNDPSPSCKRDSIMNKTILEKSRPIQAPKDNNHHIHNDSNKVLSADNLLIKKPGNYYLDDDIFLEGSQHILISSGDVNINLCGHTIHRQPNHNEESFGVLISNVKKVHIHNGSISGSYNSICILGSEDIIIENMNILESTNLGIISSASSRLNIYKNIFTFNKESYFKNNPVDYYLIGINLLKTKDSLISDNDISFEFVDKKGLTGTKNEFVGMLMSSSNSNIIIESNNITADAIAPYIIKELQKDPYDNPFVEGRSIGVWVAKDLNNNIVVKNNIISNFFQAIINAPINEYVNIGKDKNNTVIVNKIIDQDGLKTVSNLTPDLLLEEFDRFL